MLQGPALTPCNNARLVEYSTSNRALLLSDAVGQAFYHCNRSKSREWWSREIICQSRGAKEPQKGRLSPGSLTPQLLFLATLHQADACVAPGLSTLNWALGQKIKDKVRFLMARDISPICRGFKETPKRVGTCPPICLGT